MFCILVLDRNRYIRMFLKRELERKGHRVFQVNNNDELIEFGSQHVKLDLIILDPEISDPQGRNLIDSLIVSYPGTPIALHAFRGDIESPAHDSAVIACVEKRGNSIEVFERIISDLIKRRQANLNFGK